jgi:hypothetical protein
MSNRPRMVIGTGGPRWPGMMVGPVIASFLGLVGGCAQPPSGPTPSGPTSPTALTVPVVPAAVTLEGISLTANPSFVTSGGQLTMSWVAPSGRGCVGGGDWVALFRVGDPDRTGAANGHSDLWFVHLCDAASGTAMLSAPVQPGQYEFRYMVGDSAVARSSPVTVNASATPLALTPTLNVDGGPASSRQVGQTFWITGSGYTARRRVSRYINPAVNGSTEITPLTADESGNVFWNFTPTCGNPAANTVAIYAVDDATGRTSNTITETITGSTSCP